METIILFYVFTMMKYCVWNVLYQVNSDDERSTDTFIWLSCDIYTFLGKTMGPRAANVKVQKTFTPSIFREVALYHGKSFFDMWLCFDVGPFKTLQFGKVKCLNHEKFILKKSIFQVE